MKRIFSILTASAVFLVLSGIPVFAQHGGGHGGGPPAGGGGMGHGSSMGSPESQGRGGEMGRNGTMGNERSNMPMNSQMGRSISPKSPTSLLSSNTKLSSTLQDRLGSMLPSGMSLTDAASGFKNLGQFVAAVHVSHNLDIPFSDLKDRVTGGDSLGKAIKDLKPSVKAKPEVKKAKREAKTDLKNSGS